MLHRGTRLTNALQTTVSSAGLDTLYLRGTASDTLSSPLWGTDCFRDSSLDSSRSFPNLIIGFAEESGCALRHDRQGFVESTQPRDLGPAQLPCGALAGDGTKDREGVRSEDGHASAHADRLRSAEVRERAAEIKVERVVA